MVDTLTEICFDGIVVLLDKINIRELGQRPQEG